jgi:uncharacterized GH25 family protein
LAFLFPLAHTITLSHAHGIWFAQRSGEMALIYGHGAEDLDMIRRFDKVTTIAAFDGAGAPLKTALKKTDHLVIADMQAKPAILAAVLDNGYWSKGPDDKWVNKGKDEVPGAKESGRYVKFTVFIKGPLTQPVPPLPGQVLQIVPVSAKLPHHMNEAMTVRVLHNGKPVAGAKVIRDYVTDPDQKPQLTGKDGTVIFRVRNQGLNVVGAAYESAPDDPAKAGKLGLYATLAFVLEHAPE